MKFQPVFFVAALCAAALFSSCQSDGDAAKNTTGASTDASSATATGTSDAGAPAVSNPIAAPSPIGDPSIAPAPAAAPTPPPTAEPPQNAAGVWHYTCPKGCKGGGGAATACAKCGTTLTHNTAYHAQANAPTTAPVGTATPGNTAQKPPEPPQNAAGVWHYTCPGGCPGGGGAASACAKCGKALAHNTAYHQ